MTLWDCRRLNHKVLGTHTGHLFYCESCLKEAIKTFSYKWIFDLPNTSEFKIPLSWHCERACGWEESSCKCFEGMQWKAKEVFQSRLGLPHSFVMTGSWNWKVNESWWNTWYTLVCHSLTQTFYDWKCTFQLQSHGKIWVRDYSSRDLTDFIITIIKPSNINVYILISFSRQFLISRNPHTLVLFMSVKKPREAKINKSTDFLIGFYKKIYPNFSAHAGIY